MLTQSITVEALCYVQLSEDWFYFYSDEEKLDVVLRVAVDEVLYIRKLPN